MTRLTKERARLKELLAGVNAFNAKGKAAEIGELLNKYIPAVEQMDTTLKKYDAAFTETASENEDLKKENAALVKALKKEKQGSTLRTLEENKLRSEFQEIKRTLEHIPLEVRAHYRKMPHDRKQEQEL